MSHHARSTQVSKFLALHLRHAPARIGITLDAQGWTAVDRLLHQAARHGFPIGRQEIDAAVDAPGKRRYELDESGRRIRAAHGHSVPVTLGYQPALPPDVLYHGTVQASIDAIVRDGIQPMSRQHVHLSDTIDMARQVGGRRGRPVILTIDAAAMHAAEVPFYRSRSGVWLVHIVPARYIRGRASNT
jgi:putative RNA 2'-phosphotransferase